MERLLRFVPTRCAVLWLAVLAAASRLEAVTLELPAVWPLGVDSRLFFELEGVDLHLTTWSEGLPMLEARVASMGESGHLEAISSGGSLTVRRVGGGERMPRLRLNVALGPGRTVYVTGTDVTVHAEDPLAEDSGSGSIRLALERSTADLSGVRISELEATTSSITLTGTQGALTLSLSGGRAQVQGHQGRLELVSTRADVTVVDHHGELMSTLEGGSLEISGGEGTLAGTAADAHLSFDGWRGPVEVRAEGAVLEALGGEYRDRWQIDGHDIEIILEQIRGTIEATLEGGVFNGNHLSGGVQVTAEGSRLDLVEVVGNVTLDLTDGAEAVVAGVAGTLEAAVEDSRLEVERVGRMTLTGIGADVVALGIEHLESLVLSDSELTLDLRGSRSDSALDLRGEGYARVQLTEPCVVQLSGAIGAFGNQADVNGCELRPVDQQVSRRQDRLKYDGVPPIRLTVSVSRDAVLEVEGEP